MSSVLYILPTLAKLEFLLNIAKKAQVHDLRDRNIFLNFAGRLGL